MKKSYFMKPETDKAEWDRAWDLAVPGPDKAEENPQCFEVWQYMGTWLKPEGWIHEFRHRSHPRTGKRVYLAVPASPEFALSLTDRTEVVTW